MRIIAVTNQKGGVGKTSTAVNLSAALCENGRKTLLIDLDSQANATTHCGIIYDGKGILEIFVEDKHNHKLIDLVHNTEVKNLDLIPGSEWLSVAEKTLAGETGAELLLKQELKQLPKNKWDYIIIDCPPSLGILTINALAGAKEVVVPVASHYLAMKGLAQLLKTVDRVAQRLNPKLKVSGVLACRVVARAAHSQEVISSLREHLGDKVYKTIIRENIKLAEAPSFGKPITIYDSRSIGAADYRSLANEVILQEEKA